MVRKFWQRVSGIGKENALLTGLFLFMPKAQDFMINIFVIALLPAIAEELFSGA